MRQRGRQLHVFSHIQSPKLNCDQEKDDNTQQKVLQLVAVLVPFLQTKHQNVKCYQLNHFLLCDCNNLEMQRQSLNIRGYPTPTLSIAERVSFITCSDTKPSLFVPETSTNSEGIMSPGYFPLLQ